MFFCFVFSSRFNDIFFVFLVAFLQRKTNKNHCFHRASVRPYPRYQFATKLSILRIISTGPWFHRIHAVGKQGDAEKSNLVDNL